MCKAEFQARRNLQRNRKPQFIALRPERVGVGVWSFRGLGDGKDL